MIEEQVENSSPPCCAKPEVRGYALKHRDDDGSLVEAHAIGMHNDVGDILPVEEAYSSVRAVLAKFLEKLHRTHPLRIIWVLILILLVTSGNAMQIIGLNFWIRSFPKDGAPGNFATLAVSSLLFGLFFLLMLVIYLIIVRPSLAFLRCARGWWLLFLIGLADAVNSYIAIYAASYTPEVLQAVFTTLVPVYAAGFTKWILKDPRNYCNIWVFVSFLLIVSGVVVASTYQFARGFGGTSKDKAWWSLFFFLSVPPTVLMNIWQSLYMLCFTYDPSFEEHQFLSEQADPMPGSQRNNQTEVDLSTQSTERGTDSEYSDDEASPTQERSSARPEVASGDIHVLGRTGDSFIRRMQGSDALVKLVMLTCGTNIQFVLVMLALPMDAIPWWGGSHSVQDAWTNFSDGLWYIFHCENTFIYCMVYTVGFVFTYVGSAYLNQHSVTLCSMIGQLSSPFTALILIIVPKWDLEKGYTPWYISLIAIILLCVGSFVYTLWEEKTEQEKEAGEHRLKETLLFNMRFSTPATRLRRNSVFFSTAHE
ncbi:hypothetical protein TraAM80_03621 [Trypanosoma rangeli]|uniref:Uncharacterized protein n=1 Tax=Trypanosoma rangeli TaxID=5698 RepID=A0A422NMM7_TRYRA|nr:uncharacterized protein TraAM80_03621 [Trypanosoma rangeli]RNF06676.1 hypothetical protein TraAM80_03621 [Trypanosoma rangeli]|eukprot:RNF06676.1 hypothetical protein TraAM80_03621 [Trypanosoma rangeli]